MHLVIKPDDDPARVFVGDLNYQLVHAIQIPQGIPAAPNFPGLGIK